MTGRSLVVVTVRVLAPAVPLVVPRRGVWRWSVGVVGAPGNKPQGAGGPLWGVGEARKNTAGGRGGPLGGSARGGRWFSWGGRGFSPPFQVEVFVPVGSTTVRPLPASFESPPVAETANAIT